MVQESVRVQEFVKAIDTKLLRKRVKELGPAMFLFWFFMILFF